jgi:hypothetical protein
LVGEFLVLVGAFDHHASVVVAQGAAATLPHPKIMTIFAATGVILSAVYLLVMFQKLFFGPVTHEANKELKDASGREIASLVPLVVMTIFLGVLPYPLLKRMEPSVKQFLAQYHLKYKESVAVAKAKGKARKARIITAKALAAAKLQAPIEKKKYTSRVARRGGPILRMDLDKTRSKTQRATRRPRRPAARTPGARRPQRFGRGARRPGARRPGARRPGARRPGARRPGGKMNPALKRILERRQRRNKGRMRARPREKLRPLPHKKPRGQPRVREVRP